MVNELYHHGIKGQRWGVRRYRNSDGSLTVAGRKRYDSMSGKKLHKTLKKEFYKERRKRGFSKYDHEVELGQHGRAVQEQQYKRKIIPLQKKYNRDFNKLDRKLSKDVDSGKMSYEEYDSRIEQFNKTHKPQLDKLVNQYKRDLTMARIQDLGYSRQVGHNFTERMLKDGYLLDFM